MNHIIMLISSRNLSGYHAAAGYVFDYIDYLVLNH